MVPLSLSAMFWGVSGYNSGCDAKERGAGLALPSNLHKGADPSKYEVDIEDMIEKGGCSVVYYKLEECLGEHDRDWTKCQKEVKALNTCNQRQRSAGVAVARASGIPSALGSDGLSGTKSKAVLRSFATIGEQVEELSAEVRSSGAAAVTGVLTPAECLALQLKVVELCGKAGLERGLCLEIGSGRFHSSLLTNARPEAQNLRREIESSLLPRMQGLLTEYFGAPSKCFLSEIQLLRTLPGCAAQAYHIDNASEGLTLIVALDEFRQDLGPTRLLRGSHEGVFSPDGGFIFSPLNPFPETDVELVDSVMSSGTGVLFDARTLHRGLCNVTPDHDRHALVLRWDRRGKKPPGLSLPGIAFIRWLGTVLESRLS